MKTLIYLIAIITVFTGCEKIGKYCITISNNSEYPISVYGTYIQPDTSISSTPPQRFITINSNSDSQCLFDSDVNDERFERLKSEKLTIFVFNTDTLEKYDWETIQKEYKILKRYELNHEDLMKINNVVTYP